MIDFNHFPGANAIRSKPHRSRSMSPILGPMTPDPEMDAQTPKMEHNTKGEPEIKPEEPEHPGITLSKINCREMHWTALRNRERSTTKGHIERSIDRSGKFFIAADQDKWPMIWKWWEAKIRERELGGKGSIRLCFAEHWNEAREIDWFQNACRNHLKAKEEEKDDEEYLPGRKRVKQEQANDSEEEEHEGSEQEGGESEDESGEGSEDESDEGSDDEEEDEDDERSRRSTTASTVKKEPKRKQARRGPIECTVCTRGLAIKVGCVGSVNVKAESDNLPGLARVKVESNSDSETSKVDVGLPNPNRGVKRSWQWIGGNLVIWPPFEAAAATKVEHEKDAVMSGF